MDQNLLNISFLFSFLILVFSGCEKEYPIDVEGLEVRQSISAAAIKSEGVRVYVETADMITSSIGIRQLTDANVRIITGGYETTIPYNPDLNHYYLDTTFSEEEEMELIVEHPSYPAGSGVASIPKLPEVHSLRFNEIEPTEYNFNPAELLFSVQPKQSDGAILITLVQEFDNEFSSGTVLNQFETYDSRFEIASSPIDILDPEYDLRPKNTVLGIIPILSMEEIKDIQILLYALPSENNGLSRLKLSVTHISEAAKEYMVKLKQQEVSNFSILTTAVRVPSNIDGGHGLFYARNSVKIGLAEI